MACDYDGTLASGGRVNDSTLQALEQVRASGRRLILVTGREIPDLQRVFPRLDLFESVVAENGALVYDPASNKETPLADPPPPHFAEELRRQGVDPLSQGRVIVATWSPHETIALKCIQELGLELQVIFNKGAVMVLPSGINKAVGLQAALTSLKLSAHNVVGVGDAENDHAFLEFCECSAAVANALPSLKADVDIVTAGDHGEGVVELARRLLDSDLQGCVRRRRQRRVVLGQTADGYELSTAAIGENLLVAGASGSGKSSLAKNILESLRQWKYQFCIVDPEGDYDGLPEAVTVGDGENPPSLDEISELLDQPEQNVVINLLAVTIDERPSFFARFLERIRPLRKSAGRPHRLILDEAHHLLPASPKELDLSEHSGSLILLTVHPDHVARSALASIDHVLVIGKRPDQSIRAFAEATGREPPEPLPESDENGGWSWPLAGNRVIAFQPELPPEGHKRHKRKYAKGELGDDKCFYFRGPKGELNLKADNLVTFLRLADGVDQQTWLYHLQRQDYSQWLRDAIKDETLAAEVEEIETAGVLSDESRAQVRAAIERRYTAPE
jgi:hydroxymethylpyrimidine pyrophosphatase-like HAD family hydrolase